MGAADQVAVVLLAAGESRRFGGSKQLHQLAGRTLVRRMAAKALACRAGRKIAVLGARRDEVAAELAGLAIELVDNENFAAGQSTSVRAGLAAAAGAAAILFLPVDMPFLKVATLDRILEAWETATLKPAAVVPLYGGQRGAPVLVDSRLFPEIAQLSGDQGARVLLGRYAAELVELPVADAQEGHDVDTAEDLPARFAETALGDP